MRLTLAATAAAAGILLASSANPAPDAGPLAVQDVLRAPNLASYSPPSLSADNRYVAYVVTDPMRRQAAEDPGQILRSGVAWYGVGADVWVSDLQTGAQRNITGGGHSWDVSWSPDGQRLLFMADRSGATPLGPARLWSWERASGQLRQVSDADVRGAFSPLQWGRDQHSVIVTLFPAALGRDGWSNRIKAPSPSTPAVTPKTGPQIFEFDPSVAVAVPPTDQVNPDYWLRDLAVIDVSRGAVERLTRDSRIGHFVVSPDRRRLAYTVLTGAETPGGGQYLYDVIVRDFASSQTRLLARNVRMTLLGQPVTWSRGSDRIAWRTGGPGAAADEIYVASYRGGTRRIAQHPKMEELTATLETGAAIWDANDANVYFIRDGAVWRAAADGSGSGPLAASAASKCELIASRQQRLFTPQQTGTALVMCMDRGTKRVGFARIDLRAGAITPALSESKRYGGYGTEPTISDDGKRVVYVAESQTEPANLFMWTGGAEAPLRASDVAPALANRPADKSEVLEWRSLDGKVQHGALLYPTGYTAGTRYPLIVKIYGGSSISDDINRFGHATAAIENLQLYTSRGYAVLLADSELSVGTPMVDLMKSVMPGINAAIDRGVADVDRIGVTGHSYGGYSSLALIAQSPLFKAAVMRAGMGDLFGGYGQLARDGTNYGLAWAESGQGRMGGSPWEFRERYLENSPALYLDRVQTPLLIIHGELDDAVPVYLADQVFTGLRRLGKTVSYARYPGEGHWEGTWSHADQVDALNRQIAWFDRHLKVSAAVSD